MKVILAISGGVDSMALLDMAAKKLISNFEEIVVAHFDHGIRQASHLDGKSIAKIAAHYGFEYFSQNGNLGANTSEELARKKRYEFLRKIQNATNADAIATAHHQDDLLETIAINIIRGTGWRGLAPMQSQILRPLIAKTKSEIVSYAIENNLEWIEDETNFSHDYLRNRVRAKLMKITPKQRAKLIKMCETQSVLRTEIALDVRQLSQQKLRRYDVIMWPENVANEVLRNVTKRKLTTPQISQILLFAKVAKPGKTLRFGDDVEITATIGAIHVRTS